LFIYCWNNLLLIFPLKVTLFPPQDVSTVWCETHFTVWSHWYLLLFKKIYILRINDGQFVEPERGHAVRAAQRVRDRRGAQEDPVGGGEQARGAAHPCRVSDVAHLEN